MWARTVPRNLTDLHKGTYNCTRVIRENRKMGISFSSGASILLFFSPFLYTPWGTSFKPPTLLSSLFILRIPTGLWSTQSVAPLSFFHTSGRQHTAVPRALYFFFHPLFPSSPFNRSLFLHTPLPLYSPLEFPCTWNYIGKRKDHVVQHCEINYPK